MLILVLSLVFSSFLVTASEEWVFVSGDNVCQYSLGESMDNSVDCDPNVDDYLNCFFNNNKCVHQEVRSNYINFFQIGLVGLFGLLIIKELR